jgi:hypothetical protein
MVESTYNHGDPVPISKSNEPNSAKIDQKHDVAPVDPTRSPKNGDWLLVLFKSLILLFIIAFILLIGLVALSEAFFRNLKFEGWGR